jgi:hypothetical protein
MRKNMSLSYLGCTILVLVGGIALGGASAVPSGPDYATDQAANFAAAAVSDRLQPVLSDVVLHPHFAGIQITPAGLEISLSGAATAAEQALAQDSAVQTAAFAAWKVPAGQGQVPVVFRPVPNSWATLNSLTGTLNADAASWAAKGVQLSSWGPDVSSNSVVVHLESYSDAAAAALTSKYGSAISVAKDSQDAVGAGRIADSAPWYGGDAISLSSLCTSWFSTISAGGAAVSPTAGHCGAGTFTQGGVCCTVG